MPAFRSFLTRVGGAVANPRRTSQRFRLRVISAYFAMRNRLSKKSVISDSGVVVSMTSFGHRLASVHLAIESIAAGRTRPARFILWIADDEWPSTYTPGLRRLQKRGLEIEAAPDFGPHKKQYPYALSVRNHESPLVVADDDVFYPRSWLGGLLSAYDSEPSAVHGYRAHLIKASAAGIAPYSEWTNAPENVASFAIMCTGVGGIIYPPNLMTALREEGTRFMTAAPRADDIWVHAVSVRSGLRTSQVPSARRDLDAIPGTQKGTLQSYNVGRAGNDEQIANAYGPGDVERIADDLKQLG